ncbi:MAG TPA: outer membrane protein assembly factor BamA [Candidatus Acidoferrales bacterium]|nr:outer membrane protein assembly factor BamA [Candidatus Acidoferrales bacterium]
MKCRAGMPEGKISAGLRVLVLLIAAFLSFPAVQAQEATLEGKHIASVRVIDDKGTPIPEKLAPLPLKAGDAFQIDAERASLRTLNQTGLFSDVQTKATSETDGLHVDFVVTRNYYNNVVRVYGLKNPPNEGTAVAALRMPLGEPFQVSALNDGLKRLSQTLQEDGFYEAKWNYALAKHPDTQEIDITVEVTPGPRAKISTLGINNQTPFRADQVRKHTKLNRGVSVTAERLDRGTERLRNYLVTQGYLGARVVVNRGTYDAKSNTLPVTLDVIAGPRVRVEVNGMKISAKQVRKLVPIYEEGDVDPDLLGEGQRNIRNLLQSRGYFDATVNYTTQEDKKAQVEVIQFDINRGARHRVMSIQIDGNKYFSTALLESRLQVQRATFLSRGHFTQQMATNDANSIRGLYLANGFLQAQVRMEEDDNYRGTKGNVAVAFHVTEGQQTRVTDLQLQGNHALSTKQLLTVISSTKGQPYSTANVTSDRDNVLAYYFDQGFPSAQFEAKETPAGTNRVQLVYHISEGQRVDVSRVLLTGYHYTRTGIIARQVTVKEGGPLREGDVIATQQKLYNLAIFDRVQVAPQNPEGTYPKKNVVVAVEEGKRYTVSYGFGFEAQRLASTSSATGTALKVSPLGILEVSRINFGGRAHTISLKLRGSTLEYQALLGYTAPNFLTYPWLSLIITGFADKASYVNTFTATRYEGSVQLVQNVSPSTSLSYRYFYRHVLASNLNGKVSVEEVPLFSQPTKVSGFGLTWIRDRRDNPADATKGNFNTADISVAPEALGSTASYLRFQMQDSTFKPIGKSLVFARSTTFGIEQPFSGSTADNIPLPERFFAGGGTSIRGFSLNQAGPRDVTTGFPVGGLALLSFNQELRFPMHLPFVGSHLGGAIFYDAGNVFSDIHHVSLRYSPLPPPAGCAPGSTLLQSQCPNLDYFSHTIGWGFRYATPIGPVRIDLAYQLNPGTFQFLNTTTNQIQTSRLPHFQFFFNIGSIF